MAKILVVDDDRAFRKGLKETIEDLGHSVQEASNVHEAELFTKKNSFELMFIDYKMPMVNGLEGMERIRASSLNQDLSIVMITADPGSDITIKSIKNGAFDLLVKPGTRKRISEVIEAALKESRSTEVLEASSESEDQFIGRGEAIKAVQKLIGKVAASSSPIIITGETGTGKEVVAKSIHENSVRSAGPFIAINCAAIPENLLESELFGHAKGSFTGATEVRLGSFRLADGGTLFLDEIGDMPLKLQAKILRSIQEKEVTPVGGSKSYAVNVRVISATHQKLKEMVERKEFREDLFYRLNVVEISLPPLRERKEDIPELAQYFLAKLNAELSVKYPKSFTESALSKLVAHSWPGNIRELKNVIERAFISARSSTLGTEDISFNQLREQNLTNSLSITDHLDLPTAISALEKSYIERALLQSQGNRSEAARILGIQRQLLYSKMREHRIDSSSDLS